MNIQSCYMCVTSWLCIGIIKDSDLGEPLTPEDFEYAESEEYQNLIANEETHGENENENPELFEGDIEMSDERGMSGIRQVSLYIDSILRYFASYKSKG